tara:strand:+ start:42 stop:188 length:147 start_codon:yes stop_codon:yes gene_type:complete
MKYTEIKNKNGKSPKPLGLLTGANFNAKKLNRDKRQQEESLSSTKESK